MAPLCPGKERQPSYSSTFSSLNSRISGLMNSTIGNSYPSGSGSGAFRSSTATNRRRMTPTCGPARPSPSASTSVSFISSSKLARRSSNFTTGRQTFFRIGSPSFTISAQCHIGFPPCNQPCIVAGNRFPGRSHISVRIEIDRHRRPGRQLGSPHSSGVCRIRARNAASLRHLRVSL